ncbi:MAG: 4-hydroxy-tetrahydrodipicolinate reductase [candidate division KSB1 bacterium]|nr:4-hydroxy-tetrahydrodipicolinate reductase [candidate division KSB1 bacterium]MDZ7367127.1 4-hydroxy-tetrahydrodipicolinate reductase [candidate division KSB1 bacterium]MDZ7405105.1 4-hydroxy-tetrahydrodipicolinate reductase [candidate division KSB1 bacterium]
MKIALIGYGKMGRLLEEVARRQNVEVVARYSRAHPIRADEETRQTLHEVTTLIDFSTAEAVLENIRAAAALSRHLVIGTTGWHNQIQEARKIVESGNLGVVYGSNFSVGVNLFYQIVERAAQLFSAFDGYDPFLEESHHKFKKDAPSGTALVLQKILANEYGERQISVTSTRAGYIPGTHVVSFDSAVDTIRLEHTARSREGFAEGALLAAKWIAGRKGFYEFREVWEERLRMKEGI